ncbi:MAG: 3-oxoacyl-[acyl-carrier-protein] synthase III C-terminal domain-containing protein [bacterium]
MATAIPGNVLPQSELRAVAEAMLPETRGKSAILDVFDNGRIESRALAMPVPWYLEPHGFADRQAVYADVGLALVEMAATLALGQAHLQPSDVDGIVLASTTGISTPSLEAKLCNRIAFRPDLVRLPVWGLGCAGGTGGLNRAADLARADPKANILVVAMELCSLSFDVGKALQLTNATGESGPDKKSLVAASLFGDGAAACVVSGDAAAPGPLLHVAGKSHLFPDTERVMGWDVLDHNLDVVLSPRIPQIILDEMEGLVRPFLDANLGKGKRPDEWVLHPGGAKVVDAYRDALGLTDAQLQWTSGALRDHGNMSSPTVLFALQAAAQAGRLGKGKTALMGSLGPGFASELTLVRGA